MIHFDIESRNNKIVELTKLTESESFWKDQNKSKKIINEINANKIIINSFYTTKKQIDDFIELVNSIDPTDFEMLEMVSVEFEQIENNFKEFEIATLLTGPYDNNNVILEFHPGSGGTESQDWANMLFNMYCKYAESKGFKFEILDYQEADDAGIKSATLLISGENAYGYLKGEAGVHRLVRISPFDANSRRHTSFASVTVTPEIEDDGNIEIKEEDIKVDTYRASGAGGQHINKTESAIRITHIATGIVVSCQSQRSQFQNKEKCLQILKSKLATLAYENKMSEINELKGVLKNIEWGSQIRSYVLCPYTLVKDNRTDYESSKVNDILNGNLDDFIFAYLKKEVSKK